MDAHTSSQRNRDPLSPKNATRHNLICSWALMSVYLGGRDLEDLSPGDAAIKSDVLADESIADKSAEQAEYYIYLGLDTPDGPTRTGVWEGLLHAAKESRPSIKDVAIVQETMARVHECRYLLDTIEHTLPGEERIQMIGRLLDVSCGKADPQGTGRTNVPAPLHLNPDTSLHIDLERGRERERERETPEEWEREREREVKPVVKREREREREPVPSHVQGIHPMDRWSQLHATGTDAPMGREGQDTYFQPLEQSHPLEVTTGLVPIVIPGERDMGMHMSDSYVDVGLGHGDLDMTIPLPPPPPVPSAPAPSAPARVPPSITIPTDPLQTQDFMGQDDDVLMQSEPLTHLMPLSPDTHQHSDPMNGLYRAQYPGHRPSDASCLQLRHPAPSSQTPSEAFYRRTEPPSLPYHADHLYLQPTGGSPSPCIVPSADPGVAGGVLSQGYGQTGDIAYNGVGSHGGLYPVRPLPPDRSLLPFPVLPSLTAPSFPPAPCSLPETVQSAPFDQPPYEAYGPLPLHLEPTRHYTHSRLGAKTALPSTQPTAQGIPDSVQHLRGHTRARNPHALWGVRRGSATPSVGGATGRGKGRDSVNTSAQPVIYKRPSATPTLKTKSSRSHLETLVTQDLASGPYSPQSSARPALLLPPTSPHSPNTDSKPPSPYWDGRNRSDMSF
ncbi:hypothetical protein KIPB_000710 [Kipferlia bialata]|uniref:Uncharacterized protein n=1 Tax=Kipferlia bialata TaxID=797122 RepID=A0A9K3GF83_9EUKA|nr:hypothetical protein KIPB_000710 [Kipferlia bialata]|eukprot:g710.t1